MNLKTQIISLVFSFVFGGLFSFFVNINYKFLFLKSKIYQILLTIVFVVFNGLIYFFLLKMINNGIIHSYFYIMIFLGFYLFFPITKVFRRK